MGLGRGAIRIHVVFESSLASMSRQAFNGISYHVRQASLLVAMVRLSQVDVAGKMQRCPKVASGLDWYRFP